MGFFKLLSKWVKKRPVKGRPRAHVEPRHKDEFGTDNRKRHMSLHPEKYNRMHPRNQHALSRAGHFQEPLNQFIK